MILDPEEEEEEARVKEQDLAYTKLYQRKKEELRISEEHKKEINTISENEPYPVHIGKDGTKWWILSNTRKIPISAYSPATGHTVHFSGEPHQVPRVRCIGDRAYDEAVHPSYEDIIRAYRN